MASDKNIGVILLAGGVGSRFGTEIPKQFLTLGHAPVALHSFEVLASLDSVAEIVIVCTPEYQNYFDEYNTTVPLNFASPGKRRQDSVYNGLEALVTEPCYACVHDAARPLITPALVEGAFDAARKHGAAAVGVPVRFTVKEVDHQQLVLNTPDRENIWEIQTPQVIRIDWLREGFALANQQHLTVTDDVSLVELLRYPVKLVEGHPSNVKITTTEDFALLENLLQKSAPNPWKLLTPQ